MLSVDVGKDKDKDKGGKGRKGMGKGGVDVIDGANNGDNYDYIFFDS